ncbi:MAG: hypothetical protein ACRC33_04440 [Gemmataceae bacterium]
MKTPTLTHRDVDLALYGENRPRFPAERLVAHRGEYVAFNWDGTEIVASAPEEEELGATLDRMGIPFSAVVFSWIDD